MSKNSEELKSQETEKEIFQENKHGSSSSEDEDIHKKDMCGQQAEERSPKNTEKAKESPLEYLMRKLSLGISEEKIQEPATFETIIKGLKDGKYKNVVTMVGAGISTAAGIPDFRSPGSGLYHNLKKYNLPYPQAIFELGYFGENPEPFFLLAKELLPGTFAPTKAHYFIKLLLEKGILLRHYTQNIDNLERMAGLTEDKLIEAHGSFYTSHCLDCCKIYSFEWMKTMISTTTVPRCVDCEGIVKPDIIFFGETLPRKFFEGVGSDFKKCDLLIIMGSSLAVDPFASLVTRVSNSCPRLILNKHPVGINQGICYEGVSRDVFIEGTCDFGCQKIADELGWSEELGKLMKGSTSTTT